jgi:hypothetical protein
VHCPVWAKSGQAQQLADRSLGWQPTTSRAGELWPWTRRGGSPAGSDQPAATAGGGRRLGHKEVAGDPVEVGEGLARAHSGLSTVVHLSGEKSATGAGTGGAGVVGDGLHIEKELVEAVAGAVRGRRRRCTWRHSWRLGRRGFGGGDTDRRLMVPVRGSGSCGGPAHSS